MFEMLGRWFRSRNGSRPTMFLPTRRRPTIKPSLEALEDRWVPSTLTLKATVSTDWFDARNWDDGAGGHAVPGAADTAVLDNNAAQDVEIAANKTADVGRPTVSGTFAHLLSVDAGGKLKVHVDSGLGNSAWAAPSANSALMLLTGAELDVIGNGSMVFSAGSVLGPAAAVNVTGGATAQLTGAFGTFGAVLNVGDLQTAGTVELKDLNGNISDGWDVNVSAHGTFKMDQTSATSTQNKGGLTQSPPAGGTPGAFNNAGTFIRDGGSADGTFPVLDYVLTNTGTVQFTPFSDLFFTRKDSNNNSIINNTGGALQLSYSATVRAAGAYLQNGGAFQTIGTLRERP
jgi:hypothetical protein